jgi:DNA-binding NarL/FixJ family response regulator
MLVDAGSAAGRIGDFTQLADVARRLGALPRSDDEVEGVLADLLTGFGSIIEGKTGREAPLVADAILRAADFDIPTVLGWAAMGAAAIGDEAAETAILRRAVAVARASGEVDTLVLVLEVFVNAAMLAGRYTVEVEAGEGLTLARDAGLVNAATSHLGALAWLAALKGRDNECRTYAAEVAEAVRSSHLANANSAAEWGVAMVDLGRGRPDDAVARLSALRAGGLGVTHPWFVLASTPDLVEACLRSGREEEARAAFAPLQAFAEARAPTWALALAARCRALLAAGDAAEGEFDEALRLHAESNRPFDRARTELLYGEFLRRQRRRTEAREHLRAALEAFEQLRAEPWEERARSELRATGETTRKRDPGTVAQLTPQEEQIARLVGEGGSNKEIAAQLFLSPRTVEYHLRKVFAKLGITSRAELIRQSATAAGEPAPVGASVTS